MTYSDNISDLQKVASAISGYEPHETSTIDDFYYDLQDADAKKQHIQVYAMECLGISLTAKDSEKIYAFLETEFEDEDSRFTKFNALKLSE